MGFLPNFVVPVRAADKPALSCEGPVQRKYHSERGQVPVSIPGNDNSHQR